MKKSFKAFLFKAIRSSELPVPKSASYLDFGIFLRLVFAQF